MSDVLIAEDVPTVREMLRVTLENAGYHVFEAADGPAARTLLRASPCPMAVVLDADLPGLGAETLLSEAAHDAALLRHAYVYLAATRPEQLPPKLTRLLSRLAVPVLHMPLDIETLLDVIAEADRHTRADTPTPPSPTNA